jgi:hypothetical protein
MLTTKLLYRIYSDIQLGYPVMNSDVIPFYICTVLLNCFIGVLIEVVTC